MSETIVAIDPGVAGGWAVLRGVKTLAAGLLPKMDVPGNKRGRSKWKVDVYALGQLLEPYAFSRAVIERVSSMPGQGVAGVFSFGRALGNLEAFFETINCPIVYVPPVVWKRHHNLLRTDKDAALLKARNLSAVARRHLRLKKHAHAAEAILIGLWYAGQAQVRLPKRRRVPA